MIKIHGISSSLQLKKKHYQKGQALLIVVLVMVVALTVGLSVAVRTTTNLRTSSESESSERAFSAAEAGIEQSLTSKSDVPLTSLAGNTSYETSVTTLTTLVDGGFNLNNGTVILKDESADLWLSTYPTYADSWSGDISINWATPNEVCDPIEDNNTRAALEIILISGPLASPKTTSYLLDPCPARQGNNNFELVTTVGDSIDGKTYAFKKTITIASGLLARIIPLYAPTVVGVQKAGSNPDLPSQGTIVTATGISDNTQRKIISFQGHPKLPTELFPFIIFSPK